jgi:hypothetical protein
MVTAMITIITTTSDAAPMGSFAFLTNRAWLRALVLDASALPIAALITVITSRTLFAKHRILIYELQLLGPTFLRLPRAASVLVIPFAKGILTMPTSFFSSYGTLLFH